MFLKIEESAIFIADAHFNKKNTELLFFLKMLELKKIQTTQLFLMGDIFDFISGESKYFIKVNKEVISLLNFLSEKIQMIYLEGNHDYNLKSIFKNIKIVPLHKQPIVVKLDERTVALSHGDNFMNWKYKLYSRIIRNSLLLKFLNGIDFNFFISKILEKNLLKKNICQNIENFEDIVKKRLINYNSDIIIEGHYHQGLEFIFDNKKYINIPSLCCDKSYIKVIDKEFRKEVL